jgi:hypothetical protein
MVALYARTVVPLSFLSHLPLPFLIKMASVFAGQVP